MSKTKIVVIQRKELIYTGIFVGLGILLICLLIFMFRPASQTDTASQTTACYKPGVYTTELSLNDTRLLLLLLIASDGCEDGNTALLTLILYLFL